MENPGQGALYCYHNHLLRAWGVLHWDKSDSISDSQKRSKVIGKSRGKSQVVALGALWGGWISQGCLLKPSGERGDPHCLRVSAPLPTMPRALSTLLPSGLIRPELEARGPAGAGPAAPDRTCSQVCLCHSSSLCQHGSTQTVVAGVADICKTPQNPPWVKVASKGLLF